MRDGLFWLNDRQWARIEPHLPTGLTGPERDDDRRIISGIIHMLQSGARWRDCPREYGPYTTIYNRFNRWAKRGRWCAIFEALAKLGKDSVALSLELDLDQSSSLCLRRKRGEHNQAIGRSRGGRTTNRATNRCLDVAQSELRRSIAMDRQISRRRILDRRLRGALCVSARSAGPSGNPLRTLGMVGSSRSCPAR